MGLPSIYPTGVTIYKPEKCCYRTERYFKRRKK